MLKQKDTVLNLLISSVALITISEQPAFFIRVNNIEFDEKPGWVRVFFTKIGIPLENMMWTLSVEQANGEPFTMKGTPIQIQQVAFPEAPVLEKPKPREPSKVVDITDRIKQIEASKPNPTVLESSDTYQQKETE